MQKSTLVAVAAILCAAVAGGVFAQQKGGKLTALDYAEIQQLYVRYNYGIDTHADNGMMWSRTFTPNGVFAIGKTETQGFEKLTEFAKAKANTPGDGAPHHYVTNIMIEASPDGATGSAYFFNVPTPEPGKPAAITGTGTYQDLLVKTADGWRFKKRTFFANRLPPSMIGETASH